MLSIETTLAATAATASVVSFTPQALKIIKTRKTKDISLGMYILTVSAFGLWTTYGIMTEQWPLVASNTLCLVLSGFILMMKVLPERKRPI